MTNHEDRVKGAEFPFVTLSDVADILRTPQIKGEPEDGNLELRMINLTDLPEYGFVTQASKEIRVRGEVLPIAEKYLLRPYDVLVSAVGTVGRTTLIPENLSERWIASPNLFVVRFRKSEVDKAKAFYLFLRSALGRQLLEKIKKGKRIPMITKKTFSQIRIPELTPEVRKEARSTFTREMKLFQKIEETRRSIKEIYSHFLEVA
jgi:restriction endonuclease S subunit